jgi:hypothetical protein
MTVRRFDRGTYDKATKTPEGYLVAPARLTRTGVFFYQLGEGKTRAEFRPDSEVFSPDSLASFQLSPLTDEHPPEWLDAKNTAKYLRGFVGESVARDGDHVSARLKITDNALVAKIENGEAQEISCGYTCDLEEAPGEWNGIRYDVIQRNIRGNHVAVVPMGRAGPTARIKLDASDGRMLSTEGARSAPQTQEPTVSMRKKKIDGVEYEVPENAAQAIEKIEAVHADAMATKDKMIQAAESKAAELGKEKAAVQAKLDAALEDVKKKDEALKASSDPKAIKAKVAARAKLETVARKMLGKAKKVDGLDDAELRLAVLKKAHPTRNFDGQAEAYLAAAWDLLVEKLDQEDDDEEEGVRVRDARKVIDDPDHEDEEDEIEDEIDDDEEELSPAEKARQDMLDRNRNAWKTTTAEGEGAPDRKSKKAV